MTNNDESWTVYLLRTNEQKLYCGITNNITRRLKQHESGKGAKALRGRGPLSLVWTQLVRGKSDALKTEHAIKKLSKAQKEQLVVNSEQFILAN
ncbi:GIY-YIG nuclease family protein [Vibrio sp. ZSDZ65]|uniref:GIY-YIG nuclease family protein n=1 Tax=Vibrio qingdaonensis TaxID=2829491 RepID=A0A9X3HVR0_9VIBR|nr:GIY-YIG nuclease family protein [Vibrio qingdaonensis]MCW8345529.1 GIY-YIG nuclease family protein [Vibrio qingdaonensis]